MRSRIVTILLIFAVAGPCSAAPATSDGAGDLAKVFHTYLGPVRAGQADFVRVEPQGDAYRVSLDLNEFTRPLEAFGFSLDSAEMSLVAEPLADGTWHVSDLTLPNPITARIKEQTISYRFEGVSFDGIYDPALAAFSRFDETVSSMSTEAKAAAGEGTASYGAQTIQGAARVAGTDAVDATVHQTLDGFHGRQAVSPPPGSQAVVPNFDLSYSAASASGDVAFEALKSWKLLDLWAYAVARAQESPPTFDNDTIKKLLSNLLPGFQRFEEKGVVSDLQIGTPMGDFGMASLTAGVTLPGIVSDGEMKVAIKVGGPSYPEALVPAWAKQLVPSEVEIGMDMSGFDLDAPARQLIEKLDVNRTPPIADEDFAAAGELMRKEGGIKLRLAPTHIRGPLLNVAASGEMSLEMPAPSGSFEVTVSGLGNAMAALQGASGDPTATQILGVLTLVHSWARQTDDGAAYFAIEVRDDGAVTVNGNMVKPPNDKAL